MIKFYEQFIAGLIIEKFVEFIFAQSGKRIEYKDVHELHGITVYGDNKDIKSVMMDGVRFVISGTNEAVYYRLEAALLIDTIGSQIVITNYELI